MIAGLANIGSQAINQTSAPSGNSNNRNNVLFVANPDKDDAAEKSNKPNNKLLTIVGSGVNEGL